CDSAGANCAAISGATAASFTLGSADVGSTVRSAVTASNSAGSASATSAQSAVVQAASTSPPPTPNSRFGISAMTTNLSSDSDADFARDMDTIKSSGAQWIRLDINWGVIQRGGPT